MRGTIQSELQWIQQVFTSSSLYLLFKKSEDHRIIVSRSTTRLSQVCKENAHTHKIKNTWCAKVTSCNSSSMITSQPSNCSSNTSDAQHSVCDVADLTPATSSCSACELRAKLHKVISSYITQRVLWNLPSESAFGNSRGSCLSCCTSRRFLCCVGTQISSPAANVFPLSRQGGGSTEDSRGSQMAGVQLVLLCFYVVALRPPLF